MAGSNKLTKAQIITALAEGSGLDKKAVSSVLDALSSLIKKELGAQGPGEITIPNMVKLKAKATPATEDRQGVKKCLIVRARGPVREVVDHEVWRKQIGPVSPGAVTL